MSLRSDSTAVRCPSRVGCRRRSGGTFLLSRAAGGRLVRRAPLPPGPGNDTIVLQAHSILKLRKEATPYVYTGEGSISHGRGNHRIGFCILGNGAGIWTNPQSPLFPADTPLTCKLIGLFNTDKCVLSGAMFNLETTAVDAALWIYDGEKLSGSFTAMHNGSVMLTALSHHVINPL